VDCYSFSELFAEEPEFVRGGPVGEVLGVFGGLCPDARGDTARASVEAAGVVDAVADVVGVFGQTPVITKVPLYETAPCIPQTGELNASDA